MGEISGFLWDSSGASLGCLKMCLGTELSRSWFSGFLCCQVWQSLVRAQIFLNKTKLESDFISLGGQKSYVVSPLLDVPLSDEDTPCQRNSKKAVLPAVAEIYSKADVER